VNLTNLAAILCGAAIGLACIGWWESWWQNWWQRWAI
jgi:hypothetical protein